jgi:hypothetical protein
VPRPLQHPTGVHTGQALISRVAPQSAMIPSRSHSRARRALAYGLGTSLHEACSLQASLMPWSVPAPRT